MLLRSFVTFSLSLTATAQYALQSNFTGPTFFEQFNFSTQWDHSFGFVNYVDSSTAAALDLFNTSQHGPATWGVDSTTVLDPAANLGRTSIRLVSHQTWQHGLFIVDLAHMPATVCGSWPAMWLVGSGADLWPANGEIDVIEYLNLRVNNSMGLHTLPGCTIAGSGQRGTLLTNDCGADGGYAGCLASPSHANNLGNTFNANGGGVYAVEWTSVAIRIWFFPRQAIPADVTSAHPNPLNWGPPDANFEGGCNIDSYFSNMNLVFNTDFCGSWAGPTFVQDGCPALDPDNAWSSCNMYVARNPSAFVDSFWAVNYVEVYQTELGTPPPPSSVLSSVVPAASTSQVSSGAPEGASTTASTVASPPSTSPTITTSLTNEPPSANPLPLSTSSSPTSLLSATSAPLLSSTSAEPPHTDTTTIVITKVVTVTPRNRRQGVLSTKTLTTTTAVVHLSPI